MSEGKTQKGIIGKDVYVLGSGSSGSERRTDGIFFSEKEQKC